MPLLSSLSIPELTPKVLRILRAKGVETLEQFVTSTEGRILSAEEEEVQAEEAVLRHIERIHAPPAVCGVELETKLNGERFLSTGHERLDVVLGGGWRVGQVSELAGASGAGKTQLCLSSVAAFLHLRTSTPFTAGSGDGGGGGCLGARGPGHGGVLYIDTCAAFSPVRLLDLFKGRSGMNNRSQEEDEAVLDGVTVHRLFHLHHLLHTLHHNLVNPPPGGLGLVVVDSLSALLAPLLAHSHPQGHSLMVGVSRALKTLAQLHGAAVLITNHSVSSSSGGSSGAQRQTGDEVMVKPATAEADSNTSRPALGTTWSSQPHTRVWLAVDELPAQETATIAHVMKGEIPLGMARLSIS